MSSQKTQSGEEVTDIVRNAVRVYRGRLSFVKDKWEPPTPERRTWRLKNPDGTYEYRDKPPVEMKKQQEAEPVKKVKPQVDPVKKVKPQVDVKKTWKHHKVLKKDELKKVMDSGHVTFISAGRNSKDPKEKEMSVDDPYFHSRHEKLRSELEDRGYDYTEVVGVYGGEEKTFLVFHDGAELTPKTSKSIMVHHTDASELKNRERELTELGKKYNQNSVLHRTGGKNRMLFTTGENEGVECGKEAWNEAPEATDYYTDIELENHAHTKFQLDVEDCIQKGLLASRIGRIARKITRIESNECIMCQGGF